MQELKTVNDDALPSVVLLAKCISKLLTDCN